MHSIVSLSMYIVFMALFILIGVTGMNGAFKNYKAGKRDPITMGNLRFGWFILLSPFAIVLAPLLLAAIVIYGLFLGMKFVFAGIGNGLKFVFTNTWVLFNAVRDKEIIEPEVRFNRHGEPINEYGAVLYDHPAYDFTTTRRRIYSQLTYR